MPKALPMFVRSPLCCGEQAQLACSGHCNKSLPSAPEHGGGGRTNGRGMMAEKGKVQKSRACVFCSSWPDLTIAGDVILDADTAHPRLEISADGRTVKDTGVIGFMLRNQKRFDSHLFVLAKEGYTSGKHYWEVNVGTRRNWALGIASESVARKGTLTLCPENGFWVIACVDGQDYLACTNPWTSLTVTGYLSKIGIFLDIPAKKVSFYDVCKAVALYTLSIADAVPGSLPSVSVMLTSFLVVCSTISFSVESTRLSSRTCMSSQFGS
uniref:B30.2/SPRY domain-containing protein n=1 Tax=Zonotrichia albicollis TaxID=44394 RepID=A0A8D2MMT3_ZONAL